MSNTEKLTGGLIPTKQQEKLLNERHTKSMTNIKTDRNKWFYITVVVSLLSIGQQIGWHVADKRFAENVRVAWVKMYPNGHSDVEIVDEEKPVDFFINTVESKLTEFVEKRYSKLKATIATDYGFANLMMSPQMQTDFLDNYKAVEVSDKFINCVECNEIRTKVREIQILAKDKIEQTRNRQQYTTLVFATSQIKNKDGRIVSCENKIVTLLWTFRPISEIVNKRSELRYNPLGQDIIRADEKNDPTPIDLNACKKL